MNEHDEAEVVDYVRERLRERRDWTADELLAEIRDVLRCYEEEAERYANSHMAEWIAVHEQAKFDAARWRRIIADPALPGMLAAVEDELMFGDGTGE